MMMNEREATAEASDQPARRPATTEEKLKKTAFDIVVVVLGALATVAILSGLALWFVFSGHVHCC